MEVLQVGGDESFLALGQEMKWDSTIAARALAIDTMYQDRIKNQKEAIDRLLDRLSAHNCSLNDLCVSCSERPGTGIQEDGDA